MLKHAVVVKRHRGALLQRNALHGGVLRERGKRERPIWIEPYALQLGPLIVR